METHQVHFIYGTLVFPGRTKYASHGRRGHSTTPTGGTLQVNTYLKHIIEYAGYALHTIGKLLKLY